MTELHLPWLEFSVLLPLIGAACLRLFRVRESARRVAIVTCTLTLICAVGEWIDFGTLQAFEAHDHWDVLANLLHRSVFVVDELSAPLLPLAALLFLMTVLSTLRTKIERFSFGWTLVSEAILLATLSCREPWGIVVLMTLATIPPWVELKSRGQSRRVFGLHMGAFVVLLALGWWIVPEGAIGHPEDGNWRTIIAGAMLTAAGLLRSGIVPVHCWMTDLFERATFGTALLFVTPMTGAYVIMRLVLPIAPSWALQSIAVVSLITAVYAAAMALFEDDARRFFCYLFLSHASLVLVGLELVTPIGLTGALCVWISVGLSLGGFGLTLRCVESRAGRITLNRFLGLADHMPTLSALFLLTGLASIGFPGTIGFVGMELIVEGAVGVYPLIGMAVVAAAALNGIAILRAYFRVFTGRRREVTISMRARNSERVAVLMLTLLIVGGGLFPQPGVASRYRAVMELLSQRGSIPQHDHEGQTEATAGSSPQSEQKRLQFSPTHSVSVHDGKNES